MTQRAIRTHPGAARTGSGIAAVPGPFKGLAGSRPIASAIPVTRRDDPAELEARTIAERFDVSGAARNLPGATPPCGHSVIPGVGSSFERAFHFDFSSVRVHTDAAAEARARAVHARAFAYGSDILFAANQYAPHTAAGRRLLAHELVHTVQQNISTVFRGPGMLITPQPVRIARDDDAPTASAGKTDQPRADDPIIVIRIDSGTKRLEMETASGFRYTGKATYSDLEPGEYRAHVQRRVRKWVIDNVRPGLRFDVLVNAPGEPAEAEAPEESASPEQAREAGPDPFKLPYASTITLQIAPGAPEERYTGPTIEERMSTIHELIEATWTDDEDEQRIIDLISEAPREQAMELLRRLSEGRIGDESYLQALDRVVDGEENQRLHEALSVLRLKALPAEKAVTALAEAPILPWHDVMGFFEDNATFSAWKTDRGKIRIEYHGGVRLLTSKDFAAEIRALPQSLFIGGMDFDPNQVVVIHDYDSGRFVPVTVNQLAGYQHAGIRKFLGDIATVASFATPVGVARTAAGKTALIVLERVLPAAILAIDENRLNLVEWFPNWGPKMLRYADIAKTALAVVNLGQFALGGVKFFRDWKRVRNMRKALEAASVSDEAEQLATALEKHADEVITQAEKLQEAEGAAKVKSGRQAAVPPIDEPVPGIKMPAEPVSPAGGAAMKPGTAKPGPVPAAPKKATVVAGVTDDTRAMLKSKPALREALESNTRAAQALKRCRSTCYPEFAEPVQIWRIEKILAQAEEAGMSVNYPRLRDRLRDPSIKSRADLDDAIDSLRKAFDEQKEIGRVIGEAGELAEPPKFFDMSPTAEAARRSPGIAEGGEHLARQGKSWLLQGKVGLFPKQVADKLRGQHFRNFAEFREMFWKYVAADPDLSKGWTPQNLSLMRRGRAPVASSAEQVGGGSNKVWQLDHKLALKNTGEVYGMDNMQIVSPQFHQAAGEK
jgi:hypothetical protein